MTSGIGHSFALVSCIIKFIMATVIITDSQIKYLHHNVRYFGIPTPSYSGYKIEELALNDKSFQLSLGGRSLLLHVLMSLLYSSMLINFFTGCYQPINQYFISNKHFKFHNSKHRMQRHIQ